MATIGTLCGEIGQSATPSLLLVSSVRCYCMHYPSYTLVLPYIVAPYTYITYYCCIKILLVNLKHIWISVNDRFTNVPCDLNFYMNTWSVYCKTTQLFNIYLGTHMIPMHNKAIFIIEVLFVLYSLSNFLYTYIYSKLLLGWLFLLYWYQR